MRIDIKADTRGLEKTLSGWERDELPFATAVALTRTGQMVKRAIRGTMALNFDNPTPYTMNSLYLDPATKTKLVATVGFKNVARKATPPSLYMQPEVEGGERRAKRSEVQLRQKGILPGGMIWVPGSGAKLNRYGNVNPSLLTQVLSATGAMNDRYANRTAHSLKRNKKSIEIFVGRPGGGRLPLGVYQRTATGLKPLLIFVENANYKSRIPFAQIASSVYEANFQQLFDQVMRSDLILSPFIGHS